MPKKDNVEYLFSISGELNVVDKFSDDQRADIIERVLNGYDTDTQSRKQWYDAAVDGFELVNQVTQEKTYPWVGAANVKYPLITVAATQFAARAYPNIIAGPEIVKVKVKRPDPSGQLAMAANDLVKHMSWQLLEEMEEWEAETDKLLHALPIVGTYFRKTYYDDSLQRNCSYIVSPLKVVVNNDSRSLETARRVTHEIELSRNDVIERERSGVFVKNVAEKMKSTNDHDTESFLEQHCWFDLDKDGYEEPYIVTLHRDSQTLCRVVPRFEEIIPADDGKEVAKITGYSYFTKYSFIPNPEGKFYDLGFAHLLGALNHSVNTLFNQMLDAGALSNLQSGYISKTVRVTQGSARFQPGEWKMVEAMGGALKDNIFPLPVRDPSPVLFQLLGLLNDMAMKIASVTDVMTGDSPGQNVPATTTLAMVEQGLKVFTSIYKRIHRSLHYELKKLQALNFIHLPENGQSFMAGGEARTVTPQQYNPKDVEFVPVTDPANSSQTVALARANALMQTLQMNPTMTGKVEILRQYYEAVGLTPEELQKVMPPQEIQPPPPSPDMLKVQAETKAIEATLQLQFMKEQREMMKTAAEVEKIKTECIKNIADAEAKEAGSQIDQYTADTQRVISHLTFEERQNRANEQRQPATPTGQAPTTNVEGPTGDQGISKMGGSTPPQLPDQSNEGLDLESKLSGGDSTPNLNSVGANLRADFNRNPESLG